MVVFIMLRGLMMGITCKWLKREKIERGRKGKENLKRKEENLNSSIKGM
jgi:stalled ribosome alternative rescue factor ArfA